MALSLMAENNDVRLAEWPAHSLYFMGTKWIDLWVVYMIFAQAWSGCRPTFTDTVDLPSRTGSLAGETILQFKAEIGRGSLFELGKLHLEEKTVPGSKKREKQSPSAHVVCIVTSVSRPSVTATEQSAAILHNTSRSRSRSRVWLRPVELSSHLVFVVMEILSDRPPRVWLLKVKVAGRSRDSGGAGGREHNPVCSGKRGERGDWSSSIFSDSKRTFTCAHVSVSLSHLPVSWLEVWLYLWAPSLTSHASICLLQIFMSPPSLPPSIHPYSLSSSTLSLSVVFIPRPSPYPSSSPYVSLYLSLYSSLLRIPRGRMINIVESEMQSLMS